MSTAKALISTEAPRPLPGVLGLEWICFLEKLQFSRRNKRYAAIAVILYLQTLIRPRAAHRLRVGFSALQLIDDVLDGDRQVTGEATDFVLAALDPNPPNSKAHPEPSFRHLQILMKALRGQIRKLPLRKIPVTKVEQALTDVIEAMLFDRRRVKDQLILSQAELRAQHRRTFANSLNLVLTMLGSEEWLSPDSPLMDAFGWCSTERDLDEDLAKGLVNIPSEVLQSDTRPTHPQTRPILEWRLGQLQDALSLLARARLEWESYRNPHTRKVAGLFLKSMQAFARRLERKLRREETSLNELLTTSEHRRERTG